MRYLWLEENPCCEQAADTYRPVVLRVLPNLKKLDNVDVTPEEVDEAMSAAPIPQQQEIEEDDYEDSYQDQQQYQQPPQPQYTTPPQPQQQQPQRVAYSPPAQVSFCLYMDGVVPLRCWFGFWHVFFIVFGCE